jgi:hypothetical protein
MERIRALINKLQLQLNESAEASEMLVTVQLLQSELEQASVFVPKQMSTAKVAVVLPSNNKNTNRARSTNAEPATISVRHPEFSRYSETDRTREASRNHDYSRRPEYIKQPEPVQQPEPVKAPEIVKQPEPVQKVEEQRQPEPARQPELVKHPEPVSQNEPEKITMVLREDEEPGPVKLFGRNENGALRPSNGSTQEAASNSPAEQPAYPRVSDSVPVSDTSRKNESSTWLMESIQEIPTLAHQTEFKEMNDVFQQYGSSSLNDKLKTEKTELGAILKDGPVKDLKKAIGINDRFLFLSELFRGDEAMYERSLKTINNFRIFPEAEYWIERELKVKLGWDESKETVKQFCQLVRRRFS